MIKVNSDGLGDWTFEIDETSSNVYKVIGTHKLGYSVSMTGIEPESLLEECRQRAKRISASIEGRSD